MKYRRHEPKLGAKLDAALKKQKEAKEKEPKRGKRSRPTSQGVRPIGEVLSSQYEEAEDELERVGGGPNKPK